jgi:hypothetical protein
MIVIVYAHVSSSSLLYKRNIYIYILLVVYTAAVYIYVYIYKESENLPGSRPIRARLI